MRAHSAAPVDSADLALHQLSQDQLTRLALLGLGAAEIVHQLAVPLTIILGGLELIQREQPPSLADTVRQHVIRLHGHATRIKWLVGQLQAILVNGVGITALVRPRPGDLNEVVQTAVIMLRSLRKTHRVTFDEVYGQLPRIPVDRDWLWHVFVNVLKNAYEAIDGVGTITIRTAWRGPDSVEVSIADSGVGIEPAQLERLGVPLATTTRGLGLGLALCHEVVAAHHGRIEVATVPGHGTTVRVVLPTAPERDSM